MAEGWARDKVLKEAFVSGLVGGSLYEISALTAVGLSSYALWAALQTRTKAPDVRVYGLAAYFLDFAISSISLLVAATTYSSHPILLNVLLLTPAVYFYFQPALPPRKPRGTHKHKRGKSGDVPGAGAFNPFLTAYRGGMMAITCIAILAVDFRVFPRRFAKTETWGTSLMDLGVGSVVFSMGVVASRQPRQGPVEQLLQAFRSSAIVLFIGVVRMITTKSLEYQEHVTEYGVHWNFFVTLGLLPPFVTIVRLLKGTKVPFSVFAGVIMIGYQWALSRIEVGGYRTLTHYIILKERNGLFSCNREGILSFLGYLSIFLVGLDVGSIVLPSKPVPTSTSSSSSTSSVSSASTKAESPTTPSAKPVAQAVYDRKLVAISLSTVSFVSLVTFRIVLEYFQANLPYVLWVVAHNTTFLLGYLLVQTLFFPNPATPYEDAVPWTLDAINRNGLAANLLTGAINLGMKGDTIDASTFLAMAILCLYTLVFNVIAGGIKVKGWKLKL